MDAIGARAETTIEAHASAVLRCVRNCKMYGKTPSIPLRGPMPLRDQVGMGLAVEMEMTSLTSKGRIKEHAQWDAVRKSRSTFT